MLCAKPTWALLMEWKQKAGMFSGDSVLSKRNHRPAETGLLALMPVQEVEYVSHRCFLKPPKVSLFLPFGWNKDKRPQLPMNNAP